jgi:hypothetical protein
VAPKTIGRALQKLFGDKAVEPADNQGKALVLRVEVSFDEGHNEKFMIQVG